jgi:hypothetical protein
MKSLLFWKRVANGMTGLCFVLLAVYTVIRLIDGTGLVPGQWVYLLIIGLCFLVSFSLPPRREGGE